MSGLFSPRKDDDFSDTTSTTDVTPSGRATRKRVGFQSLTTGILDVHTPDTDITPSLKPLPPSRDCYLSARPILKATPSTESITYAQIPRCELSWHDKMDSLLAGLGSGDWSTCYDAYRTMLDLIKACEEPPENAVLMKRMGQLQNHLKRDLVVLDNCVDTIPPEERINRQGLVVAAQKMLATMVWNPSYSTCMTDDFRVWTVERAISVLEARVAPKQVMVHYMHFLAAQNYKSGIMTNKDRALRILEAVSALDDHVSGTRMITERCLIYQKLMDQSKSSMKNGAGLWIKHLIVAMGHRLKAVRDYAINTGDKACTVFPGSQSIMHATRQALAETNDERTLSISVTTRLEKILSNKDEANHIPQIWTIVVLMANNQQTQLEQWNDLHDWLRLLQRCFNCSDHIIRAEAFAAWSRLYPLVRPLEASEKVLSMLSKPSIMQLDKTSGQAGKRTRQAAISSYCTLLYYMFRPAASHKQYTQVWNNCVVKCMTRNFLSQSKANCDLCCRILAALFYTTKGNSKIWSESRIRDSVHMEPSKLPAIDSKWIRARIGPLLIVVRLLLEYSSLGPIDMASNRSYAADMWRHLLLAVKEASNKEVIPSSEARAAVQSITDFHTGLRPSWTNSANSIKVDLLEQITSEVMPVLLPSIRTTESIIQSEYCCPLPEEMEATECDRDGDMEQLMPYDGRADNCNIEYFATTATRTAPLELAENLKASGVPHYNVSQSGLVPVDSPLGEVLETRLMAEHENDTRYKRRSGTAMVLVGLQSSPSPCEQIHLAPREQQQPMEVDAAGMQLPSTPPLPRIDFDNGSSPATPTPKSRKIRTDLMQLEVMSSPASVVDQKSGVKISGIITSSPIRGDDAAACPPLLEGLPDDADMATDGADQDSTLMATRVRFSEGTALPEIESPTELINATASEESHEVVHDFDTVSCQPQSDDLDDLAASQLTNELRTSQSLQCDSEVAETDSQLTRGSKKRKHDGYASSDGKRRKRRKPKDSLYSSSQAMSSPASQVGRLDKDEGDCIVLITNDPELRATPTIEQSTPSSVRRHGAATRRNNTTSLQVSTPTPDRGRGRPRKKSRRTSHTHQPQMLPLQHDTEMPDLAQVSGSFDIIPDRSQPDGSEAIANETTLSSHDHDEKETRPDAPSSTADVSSNSAYVASESTVSLSVANAEQTSQSFDVESELQLVLNRMDGTNSTRNRGFDLTTVFSLCAKIGLRAQEMMGDVWRQKRE